MTHGGMEHAGKAEPDASRLDAELQRQDMTLVDMRRLLTGESARIWAAYRKAGGAVIQSIGGALRPLL